MVDPFFVVPDSGINILYTIYCTNIVLKKIETKKPVRIL
jgi:hypothetical protein